MAVWAAVQIEYPAPSGRNSGLEIVAFSASSPGGEVKVGLQAVGIGAGPPTLRLHRTVKTLGGPAEESWTTPQACPLIQASLDELSVLPQPSILPLATTERRKLNLRPLAPESGTYRVRVDVIYAGDPRPFGTAEFTDYGDGSVSTWVRTALERLKPCWRPTSAETSPQ